MPMCEKITHLQLQATGRDLLRRGRAGPEVVHLDRRPVPRRLVARRRGAFLDLSARPIDWIHYVVDFFLAFFQNFSRFSHNGE